jgi:hypothetical protein
MFIAFKYHKDTSGSIKIDIYIYTWLYTSEYLHDKLFNALPGYLQPVFFLFIEFIYSGHRIQKYIMVTHYKKQIEKFFTREFYNQYGSGLYVLWINCP